MLPAILTALEGHVVILDAGMQVVECDPGASEALGLAAWRGGPDIGPAEVRAHFAARGFHPFGPLVLAGGDRQLWVFQDGRGRGRREELEMLFLRELLATLQLKEGLAPAPDGTPGTQRLWDLAMEVYREVVVPQLIPGGPGGREDLVGPGSGPTVLVVDDSRMVRRMLRAILDRDYRVLLAGDGDGAMAMALEHQPDLILLDAVMPVVDGFAVCASLKADPRTREIPVLFLTALQSSGDEVRALEAGAVDFIRKPVDAGRVLARVRRHVGLKVAKERLADLAMRDGLTGLANRRHFDQVLAVEWIRCRRDGRPISLIMGDVDAFKAFNDTCGHQAGDACLRTLAALFRDALRRPADLAARYGGEEFVCLLPGTDLAGAAQVAEALGASIAGAGIPHPASPVAPHVTMSLGVATDWPVGAKPALGLVAEADRRMYEAKRRAKGGR